MKRCFTRSRPTPPTESATVPTGDLAEVSDEEFLRRFVIDRDERAFAHLVSRHGGMVLGVCRRMLGNPQDAEDAFQAVFLVLARKATSLRRAGSLPAWLHKTAFRIGLRARAVRAKRREQTSEELDMFAGETLRDIGSDYERSIVDEELNALPERFRLPIFLCCVEGKSLDVAARQLGWTVGSVKGRLERGRAELRRRLLLRRVPYALAVACFAALGGAAQAASVGGVVAAGGATVAPSLIVSTAQAGLQVVAGHSPLGYVSQNALNLTHGSLSVMSLTTTKIVVSCLTLFGLAAVGGARMPSTAVAGGGSARIVLESGFAAPPASNELLLALADEREGTRKPAETEGRRSPEADAGPRAGAREGERAPGREGAPREGAREGAPREGAREGSREGAREGANALANFRPETQREAALFQMILQLQREVSELRRMVQARDGQAPKKVGTRDGDAPKKEGPRDGDAPKKEGPRDGDAPKKDAPRDGEK